MKFSWCDAFKPSKKTVQQTAGFEKACAVFNIGALFSQEVRATS